MDALDCIDKKLPDRKLSTEGDWFLSLVYDSKLAKDTSERVCAAFPGIQYTSGFIIRYRKRLWSTFIFLRMVNTNVFISYKFDKNASKIQREKI